MVWDTKKPHNEVSGSFHPQQISVSFHLSLTREDISAPKYKKFWLLACEVLLISQYLCNFGAQPAVQQQCSCHMLICLMSLSHQKVAREGKSEAEL